jgi:hypothetical protein
MNILLNIRTTPMARAKRTSSTLTKAEQRLAGMRSIDPYLDLGNGLNLETYNQQIYNLRSHLETYTTILAQADDLTRKIRTLEAELNKTSERMLMSIGGRYGRTSSEYGKAGGIPRGERRRKLVTTPTTPTINTADTTETIAPINGNSNGKAPVLQP